MEYKGEKSLSQNKKLFIYDDYGHHPVEIKATLEAMREKYKNQNLIVVFQPHLFSRTKIFLKEFSESFDLADKVFILPIYAAREKFDESVSSELLSEKINNIKNNKSKAVKDFLEARNDMLEYIEIENSLENEKDFVLLTIGAGEAYKVGELILERQFK
jgi:UDP-N-acetylmuramate--alanine ligase